MKIVIKENSAFGKFIGYLANENQTPIKLPDPIGMNATRYTGEKENIIKYCKRDALVAFDCTQFEILDLTK